MNSQAIATLVVWAIGISVGIVVLVIFKDFVRWLLGISDIIRLMEEQNKLLEQIAADNTRNVSKPIITKVEPAESPATQRQNPLTRK